MFDQKALAELSNALAIDQIKAEATKRDMLKLAQDVIIRDELLREGHDLLAAAMLRSGLVFNVQAADLTAKVKAWNHRLQTAKIINIVAGRAL